jgi:hypothetical protein
LVDEADTAVTASGTFTNDGIFRRAEQITAVGVQDFGLTNVTMPVNSVTGSPTITVDRIDSDHPGTTAAIAANSERYWAITADAGGTFNVDVIFDDDTLAANTVQRTCRTDDSGANWDCVLDADPATNITRRNGVTDFSEWQNCAACGPTAISLDSVSLTPAPVAKWTWLSLMFILAVMTLYLQRKRGTTT